MTKTAQRPPPARAMVRRAPHGVIAFVLEKAVLRSVKKGGGSTPAPEPTTITSKGGEVDLD